MPENLAGFLGSGFDILFFVLLFAFTLHAVLLAYHWFKYGTNHRLSLLALAIYLLGGAALFLTYTIALNTV